MGSLSKKKLPRSMFIALFLFFGFSVTALQIIFLRIFLSLFYGNELSIGLFMFSWLFWSSIGSFLFGRIKRPGKYIHTHLFLLSLIINFTILLIRFFRFQVQPIVGLLPDLPATILVAFFSLALFAVFSGGLFPLYVLLIKQTEKDLSISIIRVYLWETIGAALGGVAVGWFFIQWMPAENLTTFFSVLMLACALLFVFTVERPRKSLVAFLFLLIFVLQTQYFLKSNAFLKKQLWQGLQILDQRSSHYGELTLARVDSSTTLYQDGIPLFTIPDQQTAEETVHYALLLHPEPQKILLIGGGFSGALFEILKHPSVHSVDYVELDPEIFNLYHQYFPALWDSLKAHPAIRLHFTDGRLFLKSSHQKYDVIIVDLPDPYTVQLNRFYTKEFFALSAQKLRAGGVFSFHISGAENYVNKTLAQYIQCLYQSFVPSFKRIAFLPGNKIYFFLSNRKRPLPLTAAYLSKTLQERGIKTRYVQSYFLQFKLLPDRLEPVQRVLTREQFKRANTDFRPMAYFFDMILWASKFSPQMSQKIVALIRLPFRDLFLGLFIAGLLFFALWYRKARYRFPVPLSMGIIGYSVMALELILVIAFQVEFGYVYLQIAIFIALFMAGMALGAGFSLKKLSEQSFTGLKVILLGVHVSFLVIALVLIPSLRHLSWGIWSKKIFFIIYALTSGVLGGLGFSLLNRLQTFRPERTVNAGEMYAWDLLGSLGGSLLSSLILIPIFGIQESAWVIALFNLWAFAALVLMKQRN